MALSEEDKAALAGLLASALEKPKPMATVIAERLTLAEVVRKWIFHIVAAILAVGFMVSLIKTNTAFVKEWGPKVKTLWWMKENGYSNKDVEPTGPIKVPNYE